MEKQVKKIADELQLIRKELQKRNNQTTVENTTVMYEAEPILSNEELIKRVTDEVTERLRYL